ncbi:hypothetical protein [Sphingomonas mesophila]|uniref:hypothetical protein n=1 Tax=Sphingomonas mesophila TaxID=2303576 RepID=UPI000E576CF4|nr:hypothetical protein [Sphingomonas mesophila]
MRYFLDTEYDGFGGALISLALVPEDGSEEFYIVLDHQATVPWVVRNVVPYLDHVPDALRSPRLDRAAASHALAVWLAHDDGAEIIADWPEDLAHLANLLVSGPGQMQQVHGLILRLVPVPGFSNAANSAVPHNALHDARALRDHLAGLD